MTISASQSPLGTKQINPGDTILTTYGNGLYGPLRRYTVESVYDNMIYVYETNNVIHIGNVIEVSPKGAK